MQVIVDKFMGPGRAESLLVLLPPAQAQPVDFQTHGFVAAVRERALAVDLVLADVNHQHVMSNTTAVSLHEQVVRPALAQGYRQVWLAGISLGAFNALHYAAVHARHVAGIALIAPYPGTGDVLAEIDAAGGPMAWTRLPATAHNDERAWWRWLGRQALAGQWSTPVYLGTGDGDRFLRGQRMMAQLLPEAQVHYLAGGHDWPTWKALWQAWLDNGPLSMLAPRTGGRP